MIKLMKTKNFFLMNKVITIILSLKLSLKVEEEKQQHKSNDMGESGNIHAAAAAAAGLIQQRKRDKTDNQQFPLAQSEDSDR